MTAEPNPRFTTTMDTGSRIYLALETAWREIQHRHPEVPDVAIGITTSSDDNTTRWDWDCHPPDRWQRAAARHLMPGLDISGPLLALGGRRILQVMLHEAAHALAHARTIKATASGGRYHNRRFTHLAHELGLTAPATPDPVRGLAACTLDDQAAAGWHATIQTLDRASSGYLTNPTFALDGPPPPDTPQQRAGKRIKVTCGCPEPRTLQVTPKSLETGPILCGVCHQPFQPADPDQAAPIRRGTTS